MSDVTDEVGQAHQEVAAQGEALIKVMLQPTTCGVMKFENGQRLIVMTQGSFELSLPLGPGEAEQLSQELHVPAIDIVTPGEARASGVVLP
jgi:hypothetical protein